MELRVLGPIELVDHGRSVPVRSSRHRAILAALAIHVGQVVTADRLIDLLWGGKPPATARGSLHSHVSRLRKALEDCGAQEPLVTAGSGYVLELDRDRLDALRFEHLAALGRERLEHDPGVALGHLEQALALWRGPAYGDMGDAPFARAAAARLDEIRLTVMEDRADAVLRLGRHADVVGDLEALLADHPLRERFRGQLMLALYRCGRRAEALDVYRAYRETVRDELGLDPSPPLRQLESAILRDAPDLAAPERRPSAARAAPTGRPRARGDPLADHPAGVPEPPSSFVGRHGAIAEAAQLLRSARVVTVTGVGGVGKTRFAGHLARRLADHYPDGVWLCQLAPIREEGAVAHAVAGALGVHHRGGVAVDDAVVSALRPKHLLLVLDNCEHVVDAAARLAAHVVALCHDVSILATSRQRLAVDGEHVYPLPPLTVPATDDAEVVAASAAVRLFCDRATAADPTFRLDDDPAAVADVCRRLDGLPLAIELAAARVAALRPRDLADRLGERMSLLSRAGPGGGRHRTLHAAIAWSHDLLTDVERRLFARLSVFAGGFTLAAAEAVCGGPGLPADTIADVLSALVDKSMLLADRSSLTSRFRLLEPLRQFGAARLAEAEDGPDLPRRHASYYVGFAEQADAGIRGREEARWVRAVQADLDNLRAAHRWAVATGDADLALRLSAALYVFALYRLRDEVFAWVESAAAMAGASAHPMFPVVHGVLAHGLTNRGELDRARALATGALALTDDGPSRLPALATLAATSLYEGRLAESRDHAEALFAIGERARTPFLSLTGLGHVPLALAYEGRHDEAVTAAETQLRAAEELANPTQLGWAWYGLGETLLDRDPQRAMVLLERAREHARSVDNRLLEGVALVSLTTARGRTGEPRGALCAFREVVAHWREAGDWVHQWTTLRNLVELFCRLGRDEPAGTLLGACMATASAAPAFGRDADRQAEVVATLRERLGDRFDVAVGRGRGMTDDEAVRYALAELDLAAATA